MEAVKDINTGNTPSMWDQAILGSAATYRIKKADPLGRLSWDFFGLFDEETSVIFLILSNGNGLLLDMVLALRVEGASSAGNSGISMNQTPETPRETFLNNDPSYWVYGPVPGQPLPQRREAMGATHGLIFSREMRHS